MLILISENILNTSYSNINFSSTINLIINKCEVYRGMTEIKNSLKNSNSLVLSKVKVKYVKKLIKKT